MRSELNVCEKVLNEMDAQSDGMGKTYSCGENTAGRPYSDHNFRKFIQVYTIILDKRTVKIEIGRSD